MRLKKLEQEINSTPLDDFLGLSPEQMYLLLYHSFEEFGHLLSFNSGFRPELLEDVPVVQDVRVLMNMIGTAGAVKATQNGFLPKKIVNAIYKSPIKQPDGRDYTMQSEEYCPEVLALRYAVTDCGWLKKQNQKFSLTKKGQKVAGRGFDTEDYTCLLKYWMRRYSWAFADGYGPCGIVQQAAVFSLYLVRLKAQEFVPVSRLVDLFIRAFPMALEEVIRNPYLDRSERDELSHVWNLRFIDRFCLYFGLLERDGKPTLLHEEEKLKVKTTELFMEALSWFTPGKQESILDAPITSTLH